MKTVCMLGSGAWGTAVASLLADNGCQVKLWCYEPGVAESIVNKRCNERYLPDSILHENIRPITDIKKALEDVSWVFEAVPVKFLRSVLQQAKPYFLDDHVWVVLSKGIEQDSLLFPSQMIDNVFEKSVKKAVVSGPSFAKDVMLQQVTAVDVASENENIAADLKDMLENNYFRTNMLADLIGVQVGGALKNVMAVVIGMLDGAGFTDNTKAYLFTAGLDEMVQLANVLGAKKETLYGLSGVGDLVLTCMGGLSRNFMVGRRLGLGEKLDDILAKTGVIPEGINTVTSVYQLIQKQNIHLPIFETIYDVIYAGKSVKDLVTNI